MYLYLWSSSMDYLEFYRLLTAWFCSIAVFLNLFLLPLALIFTKYALGSFKIIMLIFAATNVAHSGLDLLCLPRFYAFPGVMVMFGDGVKDPFLGKMSIVFLCSLFCVQVFNEFLHFLYRYILLCKTHWAWILETKQMCVCLVLVLPAYMVLQGGIVARHFTPSERISQIIEKDVERSLNMTADRMHGISFLFWERNGTNIVINWQDSLEMLLFLSFNTTLIIGMFFCGFQTHRFLKEKGSLMSSSSREMHRNIFRMLVVQTILPFFILHVPGIILLSGPAFFALGRLELDMIMVYVLTCPLIEPFIVVYYLARRRITRYLCCRKFSERYGVSDATKSALPKNTSNASEHLSKVPSGSELN